MFASLDLLLATPHYIVERTKREQARRWCPRLRGRVVDVGCGFSPYRRFLTQATAYVGVELHPRYGAAVIASSVALPLRQGAVDGVMLTEVLEHLPEPSEALAEARRILRPGGLVYITVPMTWGLHYVPHDYYRFTRWGISHQLLKAGFEVEAIEPFGGLFTIVAARFADLVATLLLDRPLRALGLERGRLRLCALALAAINLPAYYLSRGLDHVWSEDVLGWSVLARRP